MADKVLLVGLDGATFNIIRPLMQAGRLPTLESLMNTGAWGELQSTIPPITPTAWTTVFTGKNPGKHGIYDFQEFDPETYDARPVRRDRHNQKYLWDILGDAGRRSIVIDVPYTYPPQPLNGIMLTGYGTPRSEGVTFTYPNDLAARVPPNVQPEIRVALPRHRFDRSQELLDEWREVMQGRHTLLRHLITEEEWDFFFTVFSLTDNLGHILWTFLEPSHPNYQKAGAERYREAFFDAYEQCDALLGELLARAGEDTTTLVMSDHGFGSVYPRQYLYRKLAEGGFLSYESPPLLSVFGDRLMKAAMKAYTTLPFLREWIKGLRPNQQETVKNVLKQGGLIPSSGAIDHSQSRVLPSNYGLQIWINEQGRFADGIVPADEKETVLCELEAYLLSLRNPDTGERVYDAAHRGTEVYHGAAAETAPDLIVAHHDFYRPDVQPAHTNSQLDGGHTSTGIFLAHGPDVASGTIEPAHLTDLVPTILYLFNQPIPPDMDGRVLTEIVTPHYLNRYAVTQGDEPAQATPETSDAGYTPEEEAEIEAQLRQLGYIE